MQSPATPSKEVDSADLKVLLESCLNLCASAETSIAGLSTKDEVFLARSLEDAMRQLELILRVLADKAQVESEGVEPKGFFQRLTKGLKRKANDKVREKVAKGELPKLNISQQGLQGNSWTIPLPELLGFLASGRKTGVLWVESHGESFLIGMQDGCLIHAASNKTPEGLRLGEILVGHGYLTRRQLERFLSEHGDDDNALSGEALLQSGMISSDELQSALSHQVQQLFHRLIEANNAIFTFREGIEVLLSYQVNLNIVQLLLESARVQDEMAKNGPLKALVGAMAEEAKDKDEGEEDWDAWNAELRSELEDLSGEKTGSSSGEPKAALPKDKPEDKHKEGGSQGGTVAASKEGNKPGDHHADKPDDKPGHKG